MMDRRDFLTIVGTATLLNAVLGTQAYAAAMEDNLVRWQRRLHSCCADLRRNSLTPEQWRAAIKDLYRDVAADDLVRYLDFEKLVAGMRFPADQSAIQRVTLPHIEGAPPRRGWGAKIFGNKRGTAIPPHGHNGMVSSHFIIRGTWHVRTYHRRYDLEKDGVLMVEPAIDGELSAGTVVTMSDDAHNLHWFQAVSQHAFTFDVPVTNLSIPRTYPNPANKYSMIMVDPTAKPERSGLVAARCIDMAESLSRFGSGKG